MTDEHAPELETVYIAGTIREADTLEAFFAEQEIEYEVVPCQFEHSLSFGGVFAGVSFQVLAGQAAYCRRILLERGFTKGLVPSSAT